MNNNDKYKLDFSVFKLLIRADSYAERNEYSCINCLSFFYALVFLEDFPLNNRLKQKYISDELMRDAFDVVEDEFYDASIDEEIAGKISYEIINYSTYVSDEIFIIFDNAQYIAKRFYNKDEIAYNDLLISFIDCYPAMYDLFIDNCGLKPLPNNELEIKQEEDTMSVVIPHELASCLSILNDCEIAKDDMQQILGRDKETLQLIRILAKDTKSNCVFVGEPGVGKTAVVENFAWLIASGNCPAKFKDSIIISLDVNSIIAGTHYRGTAEQRFRDLIDLLEANPNCILFVDEVHNLLGAGACREGDLDLANALKPILSRGKTQVIGATTTDEYVKYFSKDGALKRRFEKVMINEPKIHEIYPMIKNKVKRLSMSHGVSITEELINSIVFYASCFNFETKNPDRTLDLVDKAMAIAELNGKTEVTLDDVVENFNVNIEKFNNMSMEDKISTAAHEAGHCILLYFAPLLRNIKVTAVSIMPAEDYLGINALERDPNVTISETRDYYIQYLASSEAGRIAEAMYTGSLSAGARGDLTTSTKVAHNMVTKFALQEGFTKYNVYLDEEGYNMFNDDVVNSVNSEILSISKEAWNYAENLLKEKEAYLKALVAALLEKPMLSSDEIDALFKKVSEES